MQMCNKCALHFKWFVQQVCKSASDWNIFAHDQHRYVYKTIQRLLPVSDAGRSLENHPTSTWVPQAPAQDNIPQLQFEVQHAPHLEVCTAQPGSLTATCVYTASALFYNLATNIVSNSQFSSKHLRLLSSYTLQNSTCFQVYREVVKKTICQKVDSICQKLDSICQKVDLTCKKLISHAPVCTYTPMNITPNILSITISVSLM